MFLRSDTMPHTDESTYIGNLPKLPGDWRFEGRKIVYDGPHTDDWCIALTAIGDLIAKSR